MATSDFLALALPHQRTIDRLCVEFEDRWIESPHPEIQPLLDRAPAEIQDILLTELLKIEIVYRRRRGESVCPESYENRLPGQLAAIHAAFGVGRVSDSSGRQELEVGDVVDRYCLLRCIGKGAFGEVYMARDQTLGRDVALKVLRPGEDDELFLEEARTAARLKHSGIATVYDTGRLNDDRPYVVMEYVAGRPLRELLNENPLHFDPPQAASFVARLAETMEYAHQQGIIHRDLEPSNIIVDEAGRAKITDFGLALHELRQVERGNEVAGSLAYMSPEQVRGKSQHLDERSDVWSLGVILYELLCGRRPFAGGTAEQIEAEILEREPKPLRRQGRRLKGRLESACLQALRKDPAERWPSAGELQRAIQPKVKSRRWAIGIVLLLLAIAAGWRMSVLNRAEVRVDMEMMINLGNEIVPLSAQHPVVSGGDEVYLEIEADRAMHYYVWWIDASGVATSIHPGPDSKVPTEGPRQRRLRLPTDETKVWPLPHQQTGGLETIVVVATDKDSVPATALKQTPPIGMQRLSAPGWFFNGQRLLGRDRAGPTDTVLAAPDPLADWHQALASELQSYGAVHAVTFTVNEGRASSVHHEADRFGAAIAR